MIPVRLSTPSVGSVGFCRLANSLFSLSVVGWLSRMPAVGVRTDPCSFAEWEFAEAGSVLADFGPHGDVRGREVLDVGCGFGGKSAFYAKSGAASVVGIDLDSDRIAAASAYAGYLGFRSAVFEVKDVMALDYPDNRFDIVTLIDVIEHLSDPVEALRQCYRVLRRGGTALISFPPFKSPWGAHLVPHVAIPWAQFLFSDPALVQVWRENFTSKRENERIYPAARLDALARASRVKEIWHLNGMTIGHFENLLRQSPFLPIYRRPHVLWSLQKLAGIKCLREYIVTRYIVVLEKPEGQGRAGNA